MIWQIGRIPNEWARCLLPLVRDEKVQIDGCCKSAPPVLAIMDTINLSVRYTSDDWVLYPLFFARCGCGMESLACLILLILQYIQCAYKQFYVPEVPSNLTQSSLK